MLKQKINNRQCYVLLRSSLVVGILFLHVSLNVAQTPTSKKVSNEQTVELLALLNDLQVQNNFTFIFDEKIIQDKILTFGQHARKEWNRYLLKEISRQTNLQFTQINDNTYVIKRLKRSTVKLIGTAIDKLGMPMVGVNISYANGTKGVTSNEQGIFDLQLSPGRYIFTASYIGYESVTKSIVVDGFEDLILNFNFNKVAKLEEILVVGNRFLPKTLQETAVPVDVVNQNRLQKSNQFELTQVYLLWNKNIFLIV